MIRSICLLAIATFMQMQGGAQSSDVKPPSLGTQCGAGMDATIVFWQETNGGDRPIEKRSVACSSRISTQPVEPADTGAGK
jgi:hypothetical protein